MESHKESDHVQSENGRAREISFPGKTESQRPLIEASYGKPGNSLPAVEHSAGSQKEKDLPNGSRLDIPSLWGQAHGESQAKPSDQNRQARATADGSFRSLTDPPHQSRDVSRTAAGQMHLPELLIDSGAAQPVQKAGELKTAADQKSPVTDQTRPAIEGPDFRGHGGPASIRYNNPGAMYPGESARKFGSTGTHKISGGHLIAEFPDAVSGAAAQFDLLGSSHYSNMRVGDAIGKWCGHNGTAAYRQILKEAGIDLKSTVGETLQDKDKAMTLARTMARVEAGKDYPLNKEQWGAAYDKYREHPSAPPPHGETDKPHQQPKPHETHQNHESHRQSRSHHHGHRHDGEASHYHHRRRRHH